MTKKSEKETMQRRLMRTWPFSIWLSLAGISNQNEHFEFFQPKLWYILLFQPFLNQSVCFDSYFGKFRPENVASGERNSSEYEFTHKCLLLRRTILRPYGSRCIYKNEHSWVYSYTHTRMSYAYRDPHSLVEIRFGGKLLLVLLIWFVSWHD